MKLPEIKIGDLAHPEPGSFKIGPFGSSLKKEEFVKEGIPVIGIENVLNNIFMPPCRRYITKEKYKQLSQYTIKSGDILVTTMGTIGYAAVAPKSIGTMIIDSHLFRMRVDQLTVHPPYLCYAINYYDGIKQHLQKMSRGAIMEGLNTTILKECSLPLPPIPEQKRITSILEKADRLRRLHRYALELSSKYLQAVFLEMFWDPTMNQKHWELSLLSKEGVLDRGKSQYRPRDAAHLYGGSYPFIQTGDVANSNGLITQYSQRYTEAGLAQSRLWKKGTLCITIAANIAKTAILDFDACFPDSIVGFIPGPRVTVEYVRQWFVNIQNRLEKVAPQSAQKNINLEILRNLQIPVPPSMLQQKLAQIVQKHVRIQVQQREALRQAEHLFQTLLHQAFEGDLEPKPASSPSTTELENIHDTQNLPGIPDTIEGEIYQLSFPVE